MTAIVLAVVLLAAQDRPTDPAADLAAARALYASAAYEDALDRLSRIGQAENLLDQVDTYRALCLLALGRTNESERALEQILLRNPRYALDDAGVSPRLVVVFRAVRARVLPTAARNLYAAARADFDEKKFEAAAVQLRELLVLIGPADAADSALGMADLRVLTEGFLKLAESWVGPAAPPPPAASAPPAAPPTGPPSVPQAGVGVGQEMTRTVYSFVDRDVVLPVEISRPVPTWQPPKGTPAGLYQGLVEVVVNEQGRVETAMIRKSVSPEYDAALLLATDQWRFQAATRNGIPVKYRRSYEVIVHSR